MKGLARILDTRWGELIFALACGVSYYIIALQFIFSYTHTGAALLATFLAPAIICGIALVFIKTIRSWRDREMLGNINSFVNIHIVVYIIAIIVIADYIINGMPQAVV